MTGTVCERCNVDFNYVSQLQRHKNRKYPCEPLSHPPKPAERAFCFYRDGEYIGEHECLSCGKKYKSMLYWNSHQEKCRGVEKNVCAFCLKRFETSASRRRHERMIDCKRFKEDFVG